MRRQDLKTDPDVHYLVSRSRDWETWGWGNRMRVLSTGKWTVSSVYMRTGVTDRYDFQVGDRTYSLSSNWKEGRGTDILVEELNPDGTPHDKPLLRIIPPTQIKVGWEEGQSILAERKRAQAEAEQRRAIRDTALRNRRDDIIRRLGVSVQGVRLNELSISLDEAEALADRLGL